MTSEEQAFLGMEVHELAATVPPLDGKAYTRLKEAIRGGQGKAFPITVLKGKILHGVDVVRAVQELRSEGVSAEPRFNEWNGVEDEKCVRFMAEKHMPRGRFNEEQRVALYHDFHVAIEKMQSERQKKTQFQKGVSGNPHGRRGKDQAATISPPPDPDEKRRLRREKEARSTSGQVASATGASIYTVKKVMAAIKAHPDAKVAIREGRAEAADFTVKTPRTGPKRPVAGDDAFTDTVLEDFDRLLALYDKKDHLLVLGYLAIHIQKTWERLAELDDGTAPDNNGNSEVSGVVSQRRAAEVGHLESSPTPFIGGAA